MVKKPLFPGQLDDERVIIYERRHWYTIIKWIRRPFILLLISLFIAWVVTTLLEPTSILSLVFYCPAILSLIWLVWNALDWENDRYILTDKRVIHIEKKHLTREKRDEAPLVMIQDVYVEMKGLMTHLLYFGDVTIQTAGTLGTIRLRGIQKPRKAQAQNNHPRENINRMLSTKTKSIFWDEITAKAFNSVCPRTAIANQLGFFFLTLL